ncbi:MAG: alkaline phosphatase [Halothiobacillus sp. 14-55-98]|jgi:hypothetical protein|nr:MAG: alkaline phosphatase [Halothiobacillus sp. 14-55-98]
MNEHINPTTDAKDKTEWEAAAFRRLVAHLQERTDVQNIDMMNLTGFCRNCLSRWYREAAEERGTKLSDHDARVAIYGMPYDEWKKRHQSEANPTQQEQFKTAIKQSR